MTAANFGCIYFSREYLSINQGHPLCNHRQNHTEQQRTGNQGKEIQSKSVDRQLQHHESVKLEPQTDPTKGK